MEKFSHIDEKGKVKMVDITDKSPTVRSARAVGDVYLKHETINQIIDDKLPKGNVLTTAKIAGIQAAKKTADLIPMCHQLNLSFIDIKFEINSDYIYKYRDGSGFELKGSPRNTAGWNSVETTGHIVEKIGPILATKYSEFK